MKKYMPPKAGPTLPPLTLTPKKHTDVAPCWDPLLSKIDASNMSSPTKQALHAQARGTSFLATIAEIDRHDREQIEAVMKKKEAARSNSHQVLTYQPGGLTEEKAQAIRAQKKRDADALQRGRRMRAFRTAIKAADTQVAQHRNAVLTTQMQLEERRSAGEEISADRFMTDAEIRRLDNKNAKNAKRREVFFNTKERKLALPDMTFEEITEDFERWKEEEKQNVPQQRKPRKEHWRSLVMSRLFHRILRMMKIARWRLSQVARAIPQLGDAGLLKTLSKGVS